MVDNFQLNFQCVRSYDGFFCGSDGNYINMQVQLDKHADDGMDWKAEQWSSVCRTAMPKNSSKWNEKLVYIVMCQWECAHLLSITYCALCQQSSNISISVTINLVTRVHRCHSSHSSPDDWLRFDFYITKNSCRFSSQQIFKSELILSPLTPYTTLPVFRPIHHYLYDPFKLFWLALDNKQNRFFSTSFFLVFSPRVFELVDHFIAGRDYNYCIFHWPNSEPMINIPANSRTFMFHRDQMIFIASRQSTMSKAIPMRLAIHIRNIRVFANTKKNITKVVNTQ